MNTKTRTTDEINRLHGEAKKTCETVGAAQIEPRTTKDALRHLNIITTNIDRVAQGLITLKRRDPLMFNQYQQPPLMPAMYGNPYKDSMPQPFYMPYGLPPKPAYPNYAMQPSTNSNSMPVRRDDASTNKTIAQRQQPTTQATIKFISAEHLAPKEDKLQ